MSDTAALRLALSHDLPKARAFRIPRRPLKLFTAGAFVLAGAYGILNEQKYVSSSNAIVSAYTLEIRTPADGNVTGLPHQSGDPVRTGDLLRALHRRCRRR